MKQVFDQEKLESFLDDVKKEYEFLLAIESSFEKAIRDSLIYGTSKLSIKEDEGKIKVEVLK